MKIIVGPNIMKKFRKLITALHCPLRNFTGDKLGPKKTHGIVINLYPMGIMIGVIRSRYIVRKQVAFH